MWPAQAGDMKGSGHSWSRVSVVELQTEVREDFTIMEKALLGPSPG